MKSLKSFLRIALVGLLALGAGMASATNTGYVGWNPATGLNGTPGAEFNIGTSPVITVTGTSCTITTVTGGATVGTFIESGGTSCTFTIKFPSAAPTGWNCAVTDLGTPADGPAKAASTTTTTWVSGATTVVSLDTLQFNCSGY